MPKEKNGHAQTAREQIGDAFQTQTIPLTAENGTATFSKDSVSDDETKGCFHSLPLFVANISILLFFYMVNAVYYGGVVRTVERRFGLNSKQTGLISSTNDIVHIAIVVFVGYFGRKAHKPRIISFSILFSAAAALLNASTHFIFSSPAYDHHHLGGSYNGHNSSSSLQAEFCRAPVVDEDRRYLNSSHEDLCKNFDAAASTVHPAFYVFIISQLLSGFGGAGIHTLCLAYVDENAPKEKSPLYVGIVTSMYAIGPVAGYMMVAVLLGLPENISEPAVGGPHDPGWIGCWWMGWVITSAGFLLAAIPLWFFPKRIAPLPPANKQGQGQRRDRSGFFSQINEFPRDLMHLLSNKAYIVNLVSVVCSAYVIMGIYVNTVRYIEIHFLERAFVASLIASGSAMLGAIGGFGGGFMMSRLRLKATGAMKLWLFSLSSMLVGFIIILLLGCPQLQIAGERSEDGTFTITTDCNRHCSCSTSRKSYDPVCGSDNLTYFSSCIAGCSALDNGTYTGCDCIPDSVATPGICKSACTLLIPFAIVYCTMSFLGSLARVPATIVNFRIVDDDERSFALGINSFAINLLGFIPAPLLFGELIDSSCILWQKTCNQTGACLLYDTAKFRHRTFGVGTGFQLLDLFIIFILYQLVKRKVFAPDAFSHKKNTVILETQIEKEVIEFETNV